MRTLPLAPRVNNASEVKTLLRDLHRPDAAVYWTDLLLTVAVGYSASTVFMVARPFSAFWVLSYLVAGFALFRAGTFMHEIQHLPRGAMTSFKVGWNVVCGVPMLMPSYMYDNHLGHHRPGTYGTVDDGEYLPIGLGNAWTLVGYFSQAVLLPAFVAIRFLFLVAISLFSDRFRRVLLHRYSYFGINPRYRRPVPMAEPRWWRWIDLACAVRIWIPVALSAAGIVGGSHIVQLYALGVLSLGLNYVRNVAAHGYGRQGDVASFADQVNDSITIEGVPVFTELLFPVSMRYHSLHHMAPSIPYHNLPEAHRRLVQELPPGSMYCRTVHPGYVGVAVQLLSKLRSPRSLQTRRYNLPHFKETS